MDTEPQPPAQGGVVGWIKSDALSAKAVRTFVYAFVGFILTVSYAGSGPDAHTITGLWDALDQQWNYAGGSALIATLGTLGITGLLQRSSTAP